MKLAHCTYMCKYHIVFPEQREGAASGLLPVFSLAEMNNVRKDDFRIGYLYGKYGAIPSLNPDFADIVSVL